MLSNITQIPKNKILYSNKKNEGHYISSPRKFIPRKGENFNIKRHQDFNKKILEQFLERKKIIRT